MKVNGDQPVIEAGTCASPDGSFYEVASLPVASYAAANGAGKCYNNLSANTQYCFYFDYPTSGTFGVELLVQQSCGSCDASSSVVSSACNGCNSSSSGGCSSKIYDQTSGCTLLQSYAGSLTLPYTKSAGCAPNMTCGDRFVWCFTTPAGCATLDICPLLQCGGACAPLPVDILSISARCLNQTTFVVQVQWTTATEKNNDYFTIERSLDGQSYTAVGKMKGAGNSSTPMEYGYIDNDPDISNMDELYYRVKQTDYNGTSEYFGPIAVSNCRNNVSVDIAGGLLSVRSSDEQPEGMFRIVDQLGRIVVSKASPAHWTEETLDLSSYPKGIYFLNIPTAKETIVKKIMLQ